MKIMEDNGRKVKNGPQEWHIDVDLHVECISYLLVFGPSGPINRKDTFCRRFLLQRSHEDSRESLRVAEPHRWEGVGGG